MPDSVKEAVLIKADPNKTTEEDAQESNEQNPTEQTEEVVKCTALSVTCDEVVFSGKVARIELAREQLDTNQPNTSESTQQHCKLKEIINRFKDKKNGTSATKTIEMSEIVQVQKRGRGRPRKNPKPEPSNIEVTLKVEPEIETPVKRGRGRPRKRHMSNGSLDGIFATEETPEISTEDEYQNDFFRSLQLNGTTKTYPSKRARKITQANETYKQRLAQLAKKYRLRCSLDFSEIVRNASDIAATSEWDVKADLDGSEAVTEVSFLRRDKERSVRVARNADDVRVLIGKGEVTLLGAPEVSCLEDLKVLLEIVDGLREDDPVLGFKRIVC